MRVNTRTEAKAATTIQPKFPENTQLGFAFRRGVSSIRKYVGIFTFKFPFKKKGFFPQTSSLCPIKHGTMGQDGWILFSCFKVPPCLNSPSNWWKSSETWEKPSSTRDHSLPLPVSKFFVCFSKHHAQRGAQDGA